MRKKHFMLIDMREHCVFHLTHYMFALDNIDYAGVFCNYM